MPVLARYPGRADQNARDGLVYMGAMSTDHGQSISPAVFVRGQAATVMYGCTHSIFAPGKDLSTGGFFGELIGIGIGRSGTNRPFCSSSIRSLGLLGGAPCMRPHRALVGDKQHSLARSDKLFLGRRQLVFGQLSIQKGKGGTIRLNGRYGEGRGGGCGTRTRARAQRAWVP